MSWQVLKVVPDLDGLRLFVVVDQDDLAEESVLGRDPVSGLERSVLGGIEEGGVAIVVTRTDEFWTSSSSHARLDECRLRPHTVGENVMDVDAVANVGGGAIGVSDLDLARENCAAAAEAGTGCAEHEGLGVALTSHASH